MAYEQLSLEADLMSLLRAEKSARNALQPLERAALAIASTEACKVAVGLQASRLLGAVQASSALIGLLAAASGARWQALSLLTISDLRRGRRLRLTPCKGGRSVEIDIRWFTDNLWIPRNQLDIPLARLPYERYAEDTQRAARDLGISVPPPAKQGMHLWRYLRVAYLLDSGYTTEQIQEALGHRNVASTAWYTSRVGELTTPPPAKE